jgi:hypothetical protein
LAYLSLCKGSGLSTHCSPCNDSKKTVDKTIGTLRMAAPYGGGRILSLFGTKTDTLTIEYRDTGGALHGVIFKMPAGTADGVKKELV